MEKIRNSHNIVAGKHEVNSSLGRSRCRWYDNIKAEHTEIE
jgi:uncharacterized protein YodC (DUF2158 family)